MDGINSESFHPSEFDAELNRSMADTLITAADENRVVGFLNGSSGQPLFERRYRMRAERHDSRLTPFA